LREIAASYQFPPMDTNPFRWGSMRTNHPSIRVLVVDDSVFMRNTISTLLMKFPDVQVVGTAKNGMEAIAELQRSQPDVMTLDVDMPGMNGLDVLDYVMANHPLPVIMISALTNEGAEVTFQALERGAVDFIPKVGGNNHFDIETIEGQLHDKVQEAYQARLGVPQAQYAEMKAILSPSVCPHRGKDELRIFNRWPALGRDETSRYKTITQSVSHCGHWIIDRWTKSAKKISGRFTRLFSGLAYHYSAYAKIFQKSIRRKFECHCPLPYTRSVQWGLARTWGRSRGSG